MRNHFHLVIETPRANLEFGKELLAAAAEQAGPSHYGADRQESGEEKAQRMVRAGMKELGWDEKELRSRPKGDKAKVTLARRLRKQTTMSLKLIARELKMGSWTYVSNLLRGKTARKRARASLM